jgi:glutaredoxin-related protein
MKFTIYYRKKSNKIFRLNRQIKSNKRVLIRIIIEWNHVRLVKIIMNLKNFIKKWRKKKRKFKNWRKNNKNKLTQIFNYRKK